MKRILTIALLLSTVSLANGASWAEMFQQYMGQPVASTTATATTGTAVTQQASVLDQLKDLIPGLIANIKILAPKVVELASKGAQGGISGWFARAADLGGDTVAQNALKGLVNQLTTISGSATSLLSNGDATTQSMVKGLLSQVTQIPEFKTLLEYAKNIPMIGGQLQSYLESLTKEAAQ